MQILISKISNCPQVYSRKYSWDQYWNTQHWQIWHNTAAFLFLKAIRVARGFQALCMRHCFLACFLFNVYHAVIEMNFNRIVFYSDSRNSKTSFHESLDGPGYMLCMEIKGALIMANEINKQLIEAHERLYFTQLSHDVQEQTSDFPI